MNKWNEETVVSEAVRAEDGLWMHEPSKTPQLLNPVVLAYMGDAVFEMMVRQFLIAQANHKPNHLHKQATRYVSAKAQRQLLERWAPLLTEEEADIVRRGRNTKSGTPPKNADPADYRQATALECLVGYLYYGRQVERLRELMTVAFETNEG
ncbi:Mini-ribonuclease 3 [Paenibacillus xanthanilyticus]|uniref:Mini-ribonuclease 3 n=1 Tax=Paenibacillus xanthanilyticus TaxID=1783531 RepID=A0ABV8JWZ7_9BACL